MATHQILITFEVNETTGDTTLMAVDLPENAERPPQERQPVPFGLLQVLSSWAQAQIVGNTLMAMLNQQAAQLQAQMQQTMGQRQSGLLVPTGAQPVGADPRAPIPFRGR